MEWRQQPSCFGKLWDPNTAECAGGPDAAYRDSNGGQVRERCQFFEQCGATKQASTLASQTYIPTNNLTRFQRPVTPAPAPVSNPQPLGGQPQSIIAQQAQAIQQLNQQIAQMQRGVIQQPQAAYPPPVVGYQQMMPVNYAVPQYLTVREERGQDESIWGMLGREIVRSMGKSLGHTVANFFDSIPFRGNK